MSHFTAVLDANVLHSYPLTSLLLELAEARLFRPAWSEAIHEEWTRSVQQARADIAPEKLLRRRQAMDTALPDACVRGHETLIPALDLPDPDDRHVLAAAIGSQAQVIVTFNERDFPPEAVARFGIETQHPDVFLRHLIDLAPQVVRARIASMVAAWQNPPTTIGDVIAMLERAGLPESAAALRELFAEE